MKKPSITPAVVNNLHELLAHYGYGKDDAFDFCSDDDNITIGFKILVAPERIKRFSFAVTRPERNDHLVVEIPVGGMFENMEEPDRFCFGMRGPGLRIESQLATDLCAYQKLVTDYATKERREPRYKNIFVENINPHTGIPDHNYVLVTVDKLVPEETDALYAGDLRHPKRRKKLTNKNCKGIFLGGSVEGSEVELPSQTWDFPIYPPALDDAIEDLKKELAWYHERDNSDWFLAERIDKTGDTYLLHVYDGELKWDNKPKSKKLVKAMLEFVKDNEETDDNSYRDDRETFFPLPTCPGWQIKEYMNCDVF